MKVINIRRSIRKYSNKIVGRDAIIKMLKAAMQAPSAGNQQPWEFIVIEDSKTLKKVSELSPYSTMVAEAPVAILIVADRTRMRFPQNYQQDMAAATENLLLEAVDLGLGAVWLGISPEKDREEYISKLFGLCENKIPFAVVPIGYPLEEQPNKFIDRFDEERVTFL